MPTVPDNQAYDDLMFTVIELNKLINRRLGAVNPNAAHTLTSKIVSIDAKVDKLSTCLHNPASEVSSLDASVQEMAELCRKSSPASSKDYGPAPKAKTVARFQLGSVAKTIYFCPTATFIDNNIPWGPWAIAEGTKKATLALAIRSVLEKSHGARIGM